MLKEELESLRKQVEGNDGRDGEDILGALNEPLSYAQIVAATGETDDDELIHRIHALEKEGVIQRLDLPRWIRADITARDTGRIAYSETPLRQKDLEVLIARRDGRSKGDPKLDRPPASSAITALQEEGLVRLGDKQGDPWYLPPARGTQEVSTVAPEPSGQYLQHRSRRGRQSEAPPTPRARPPRGG